MKQNQLLGALHHVVELVGIRPVLHAIWREECLRIGIVAKECWITSGGNGIVELMRDMDKKAASVTPIGENKLPHQLKTFDFVAMYPNIPVLCLKRVMKELLELLFTYEQVTYGYKSIYVKFGYKNDEVTPKVNGVHWSEQPPVEVSEDPEIKRAFYVGRNKL